MPAADPKSVIEIRFNTPEEKKHLQPWGNSFGLAGIAKLKTVCDSLIGIDSPVEAEDEVAQVIDAL